MEDFVSYFGYQHSDHSHFLFIVIVIGITSKPSSHEIGMHEKDFYTSCQRSVFNKYELLRSYQ